MSRARHDTRRDWRDDLLTEDEDEQFVSQNPRVDTPLATNECLGVVSNAAMMRKGNAFLANLSAQTVAGQALTPEQTAQLRKSVDRTIDNGQRSNAYAAMVATRFVERTAEPLLETALEKAKLTAREVANNVWDQNLDMVIDGCKLIVTNELEKSVMPLVTKTITQVGELSANVTSLGGNVKTLVGNVQTITGDVKTLNDNQTVLHQRQGAMEQELKDIKNMLRAGGGFGGAAGGAGPAPGPPILPTPGAINAARANGIPDDQAWLLMDATGTKVLTGKALQKRVKDVQDGNYP